MNHAISLDSSPVKEDNDESVNEPIIEVKKKKS